MDGEMNDAMDLGTYQVGFGPSFYSLIAVHYLFCRSTRVIDNA